MEEKELVVKETTNEELEVQTIFNEDGLDILVEDGTIENLEEVAENGNKDE